MLHTKCVNVIDGHRLKRAQNGHTFTAFHHQRGFAAAFENYRVGDAHVLPTGGHGFNGELPVLKGQPLWNIAVHIGVLQMTRARGHTQAVIVVH